MLPSVRILASVWHSPDDDEIYEIESSNLFITLSNRDVVLSRAPTAPGDIGVHGLTLRILDSARAVTALQTVQVFVGVEPPLVYVDRTRGDGSDGNPFLIYDIHQLQAMGGTIAPMVAASIAVSLGLEEAVVIDVAQNLFGDGRATAVYQLTQNIDASETRYWDRADDGDGFIPIDGFGGELRGAGKIIDGLYIRSNARAGLFDIAQSVTVSRLGLDNIEIDAVGVAGGLAAVWDQGLAEVVWARGRVGGASRVGGLVGEFTNSTLVGGWFAGEIDAVSGKCERLDRRSLRFSCARQLGDWAGVGGESSYSCRRFVRASHPLLRGEQLVGQLSRECEQSGRRCSGGKGDWLYSFRSDLLGIGN